MALADQIRTIHTYAAQGKTGAEIAALVGVEIGDVETVLNTVTMPSGPVGLPTATKMRQAPMWDGTQWVADGVPRIVHVPFQFDTPGLLTGAPVWTPQIGDVLFDAWIELYTIWDGTSPKCDFGGFPGGVTNGWLSCFSSARNLGVSPDDAGSIYDAQLFCGSTAAAVSSLMQSWLLGTPVSGGVLQAQRILPARFVTADPVKVVVSQNGLIGGAAPGATQGAASLNLLVATPASG